MDSDSESMLISLISRLRFLPQFSNQEWESKTMSLVIQIISLIRSMDLDSQPKQQSKLMSLVTQTVSVFNSMDLDSLPKPLSKLISLISQRISRDSDQKPESDLSFKSLVVETLRLKPGHEVISLIRQIVSKKFSLISVCPQVIGSFRDGKFLVARDFERSLDRFWTCFIGNWLLFSKTGGDVTYFWCTGCDGEHHEEYEQAPLEIKHPLHQKHSLQLAFNNWGYETRIPYETKECYCCDEDLEKVFYYCLSCDYAMNIACVEKAPPLSIPNSKWHDHTLALFPRKTSLICDVCALADSNSPFYICPPCDFVVHLKCIKLPRVLRISRHPHRMHYTPSFDEGNWSCSVCRRKIDNDYGGYSCIRDGCSYAAHSKCATQSNVWDGIDLEGEPEEIEEEVPEPFVRISDGIIRYFSHEHHHLRVDENTNKDYDDNMLCQACVTPIYFGNLQCEFVLHETCANLSRKIYHPVHPHPLILALKGGSDFAVYYEKTCSVCNRMVTAGFFYECDEEDCSFRLHVQCATISEPLVRGSHVHPLFLTSKPGEKRNCSICQDFQKKETFNCIECDDFDLCFKCAALPQKVRYKHDKHILTLSYGQEETSTMTYWCEACESTINPKKGLYQCDEYCCVTLHIKCLIGSELDDLYMKPGSSFSFRREVNVLSNNQQMTRPICSKCEKRCPHKIVFECSGSILCSLEYAYFYKSV